MGRGYDESTNPDGVIYPTSAINGLDIGGDNNMIIIIVTIAATTALLGTALLVLKKRKNYK
ncbi:MAG: LPXTG cell wall anchor domain-containing protein [Bacilli bacterium]|nr:LPXTG cell wall anchor domain-containing protein [Bacilli bacterium]